MDEFMKMDIFFVVTTIAVVVLTVLLAFVLIRTLRILKKIEEVSDMVSEEGKLIREDIDEARAEFREEGFKLRTIANLFGRMGKRTKSK